MVINLIWLYSRDWTLVRWQVPSVQAVVLGSSLTISFSWGLGDISVVHWGLYQTRPLPIFTYPKKEKEKRKEKRISLLEIGGKAIYQPPLLDPTGVLCTGYDFFFFFGGIQ